MTNTANFNPALLPCPFCGSEDVYYVEWGSECTIRCDECDFDLTEPWRMDCNTDSFTIGFVNGLQYQLENQRKERHASEQNALVVVKKNIYEEIMAYLANYSGYAEGLTVNINKDTKAISTTAVETKNGKQRSLF